MKIMYLNKEGFKTTDWSGGRTTEFFIYPERSSYEERNFSLRISSAEVNDDYSVFTHLEGIKRWLMVLEGSIKLRHNDEETEYILNAYDSYCFPGSWKTESFGRCKDFNLMVKGSAESYLGTVKTDSNKRVITIQDNSIIVLYSYEGSATACYEGTEYITDRDRLILFETGDSAESIQVYSDRPGYAIKASIARQK